MFTLSTRPLWEDHYLSVAAVAAGLLLLLLLGPGRSRATPRRRGALVAMRLASIVLVVLTMLRPTIVYTDTQKQSATLVVLLDRSRSMSVRDAFGEKSRWQALIEAVREATPALADLGEDLKIKVYAFDAQAEEIDFSQGKLTLPTKPEGRQTAIGSVLEDVLRREAGQRLAGVLLLSDGAQRAFAPRDVVPQVAARQLKDLGFPLYTVAFGQASGLGQVSDVALKDLAVDPTVFVKNQLTVGGTIRIDGYAGKNVLVQLQVETSPGKMETVDSAPVSATEDGRELRVELKHVFETPGEYRIALRAVPQRGEAVTTNNEMSTYVTALKGGLNVLYLEGRLSPEQKFLRRAIGQSQDTQLDLIRIDAQRPETRPSDLVERFERGKYDVYMIGDLHSAAFEEGDMEKLRDTVVEGAGLIMLGGIHSFGPGEYYNTPLAEVLPVEMDKLDRQGFDEPVRSDMHLAGPLAIRPTDAGLRHFVMLLDEPAASAARWAQLAPLDGANRLTKKPAATVLAESEQGEPLLLASAAGRGRVMAFAADSTWHWPMLGHADEHRRFWRQVVLWLARKDQATDQSVWVKMDQRRFAPGSRVEFAAGARSAQGEPLDDAVITAQVRSPDGKSAPLQVSREAGQSTGALAQAQAAGEYVLSVTAAHEGKTLGTAQARFLVFENDLELDNPAADPTALAGLAAMTGGESISPEGLSDLLERLKEFPKQLEVQVQTRAELYDNWWLMATMIGLFCVEWFLRKKWGLV